MELKQHLLDIAEIMDAWRLFPRLIIFWFIAEASQTLMWYRGLDDRQPFDQLFVGAVLTVAGVAFKFYVDSGRKWVA